MYKCIALLKRKAGSSREQLIEYYEARHAPLIKALFPQIRDYRRNFISGSGGNFGVAPDFDVVTELWFDDRAGYEAFIARGQEPDIARQIAEDEENVFDRAATRMFVVDEQGASVAAAQVADLAAEVRALRDEREIHRTLAMYSTLLDAKDFDSLGQVFADDVQFNYGQGGEHYGLPALIHWMHTKVNCGGTQHLLGQIVIDVAGNTAHSRAYVAARHQKVDDLGGVVFDTNGVYIDNWERRPEGWRIVRRTAQWVIVHGDPGVCKVERVWLNY